MTIMTFTGTTWNLHFRLF